MLSVPVLLVVVAIAVHGRPQMTTREQGKRCSQWMSRSQMEDLRSIDDGYECAGRSAIERRGYHVRACCLLSAASRFERSFPTTCGQQQFEPHEKRIVGGSIATPNSWPWVVSVQGMNSFCGGSLIDTRHVLTAAHCVKIPNQPKAYSIYVGRHDRNEPIRNGQTITAERIFVHEKYNSVTIMDDIAVVRLSRPVRISETVNAICLPGPVAKNEGGTVWVAGWGHTVHNGRGSQVLKQTVAYTMSSVCQRTYRYYDDRKEMCAGVMQGGHGTCQGDSGGPLMFESDGTWYLNGIVSSSYKCAEPNHPSIFTRVSYYLPWIRSKIR